LASHRERYANYLKSLPYIIDLDSHLVVHAGAGCFAKASDGQRPH
jgi:hypothetical protein